MSGANAEETSEAVASGAVIARVEDSPVESVCKPDATTEGNVDVSIGSFAGIEPSVAPVLSAEDTVLDRTQPATGNTSPGIILVPPIAPCTSDGASVSPPDVDIKKQTLAPGDERKDVLLSSLEAATADSAERKGDGNGEDGAEKELVLAKETANVSSAVSSSSGSASDSDSDSSVSSDSSSDSSDEGEAERERIKRALVLAETEADAGNSGPVRSKNEQDENTLEVAPVTLEVTEEHKLVSVGKIKSIMPKTIVVESLPGALAAPAGWNNPFAQRSDSLSDARALDADTILVLVESRSAFGRVHETFGPVTSPYYIVRFNSDAEIAALGAAASTGKEVAFIAGLSHLVRAGDIRNKGYDASNLHDEELAGDRQDHSDDEAEAASKRARKRPSGGGRGQEHQSTGGCSFTNPSKRHNQRGGMTGSNRGGRGGFRGGPQHPHGAPPYHAPAFGGPVGMAQRSPGHGAMPGTPTQPIYHNGLPAPSIHPMLAQQQQQQFQYAQSNHLQVPTTNFHVQSPTQAFPSPYNASPQPMLRSQPAPDGVQNPMLRSQPALNAGQHPMFRSQPVPNAGQQPMHPPGHPMFNFIPRNFQMAPGFPGMMANNMFGAPGSVGAPIFPPHPLQHPQGMFQQQLPQMPMNPSAMNQSILPQNGQSQREAPNNSNRPDLRNMYPRGDSDAPASQHPP